MALDKVRPQSPTDARCLANIAICRALLDDKDMHGRSGGGGYAKFAIDGHAGAIVIVRPDGYIGTVAPLDGVAFLNKYFESFLL